MAPAVATTPSFEGSTSSGSSGTCNRARPKATFTWSATCPWANSDDNSCVAAIKLTVPDQQKSEMIIGHFPNLGNLIRA